VRRLRDGDKVDTAIGEAAGFGGGHPVDDRAMGAGVTDLFGRGVGGDDLPEMRHQPQRGLAAAGGAIPRGIALGTCPRMGA
jgi:hypothetical protein